MLIVFVVIAEFVNELSA